MQKYESERKTEMSGCTPSVPSLLTYQDIAIRLMMCCLAAALYPESKTMILCHKHCYGWHCAISCRPCNQYSLCPSLFKLFEPHTLKLWIWPLKANTGCWRGVRHQLISLCTLSLHQLYAKTWKSILCKDIGRGGLKLEQDVHKSHMGVKV